MQVKIRKKIMWSCKIDQVYKWSTKYIFSPDAVAKLFYNNKYMSICPSVRYVQGKTQWSRLLIKIEFWFFCSHSSHLCILQEMHECIKIEKSISRLLLKIDSWLLFTKINLTNEHIPYKYLVRLYAG